MKKIRVPFVKVVVDYRDIMVDDSYNVDEDDIFEEISKNPATKDIYKELNDDPSVCTWSWWVPIEEENINSTDLKEWVRDYVEDPLG